MANRPYNWKARGGWYLRVVGENGKLTQVKLGDTREQAYERWKDWIKDDRVAKEDPTIEVLIERWLKWLDEMVADGSRSANYVNRIRQTTTDFLVWHENLRISELSPLVVTDWMAAKDWKSNSKATAIQHMRSLCGWSNKNRLISENPLVGIEKPSVQRRETIIDFDIHYRLMRAALDSPAKIDRRFALFLVVLWHTGCRPGELASLRVDQWTGSYWTQFGKTTRKTGKQRVVYTPACAATALKILIGDRREGVVLQGRRGPYSRNSIRLRVKRLRKKIGASDQVVAYCYRHGFAHRAVVGGMPFGTVAELLGHSSSEMISKIYGHLDQAKDYLLKSSAEVSARKEARP
jgi:integrase